MDDQLSATITAMGGGLDDQFVSMITAESNFPAALINGYGASENIISDSLLPRKRDHKVKLFKTNKARMETSKLSSKRAKTQHYS